MKPANRRAFFAQCANRDWDAIVVKHRSGIHDSLSHGMGRAKIAAFNLVPEILSQGRVVRFRPNWEGRGYDSHVIAAPVMIGGKRHVALAIVNSNKGGNRFYLHEVGLLDEIKKNAEALRTGSSGETPALSRNLGDVSSIALSLFENQVGSKVVDENGEPLVVYHGTNKQFNSFDISLIGKFDTGTKMDWSGGSPVAIKDNIAHFRNRQLSATVTQG